MPSIILTRSHEDNARIAPLFEQCGLTVYSEPMIELRTLACDACGLRSVRRIAGSAPALITSAHAAELWLDLRETEFSDSIPDAYYVVGESSAELLRQSDPDVPIRAVVHSSDELLAIDLDEVGRLLYPCSLQRRDHLVQGLRLRGIEVVELPLYEPVLPEGAGDRLRRSIEESDPPLVVSFFSPSAVQNFFSLGPDIGAGAIFCAIGRTTAEALSEYGIDDVVIPSAPGAERLAEAVCRATREQGSTSGNSITNERPE